MSKFQVTGAKLPKDKDGKFVYAAGEVVEADSLEELGEKFPSLRGKVTAVLEVATPEKDEVDPDAEQIAYLKKAIKDAGGTLPGGKASVEKLTGILDELTAP